MIEKRTHSWHKRKEVMQYIEPLMLRHLNDFLLPIEDLWQPADLLPNGKSENFIHELKELQERAKDLSYDLLVVLAGDTITEEALPTYEGWLSMVKDVSKDGNGGWMTWIRQWTAEENRHGDLLNKYLYLTGRINMKAFEQSTQYLITDGFDISTGNDPYRNFIYTSFQELATNLSHRRTATLVKKQGDHELSRICGTIASDEARHAKAYQLFMSKIFEVDPNEGLLAFEYMMRKKIIMPAHFLRETGECKEKAFMHFSDVAQRLGVYTSEDYINILGTLIKTWKIADLRALDGNAEKARDYLMNLPARLLKIVAHKKPHFSNHNFSWIL